MVEHDEIYTKLDETRKKFRLIRVLPDDGEGINCELKTYSQPDAEYRALSYCWIESLPTCKIQFNGHGFFVRPNLHEYLKQIKVKNNSSPIFIDALCIDQQNGAERSSQIQLMGDIYRGAEEVVAWLGIDGADRLIIDRAISTWPASLNKIDTVESFSLDGWDDNKAFSLACAIYKLKYWSRLWIFQEVVLARVVVLQFRMIRLTVQVA